MRTPPVIPEGWTLLTDSIGIAEPVVGQRFAGSVAIYALDDERTQISIPAARCKEVAKAAIAAERMSTDSPGLQVHYEDGGLYIEPEPLLPGGIALRAYGTWNIADTRGPRLIVLARSIQRLFAPKAAPRVAEPLATTLARPRAARA